MNKKTKGQKEKENKKDDKPSEKTTASQGPAESPSTRKRRNTFQRRYYKQKRALEMTVSDPDLSAYATQYGFTTERLKGAIAQADSLWALAEDQMEKRERQFETTRRFTEKRAACHEITRDIVDTSKLAFKNERSHYNALMLGGTRPRVYAEWVAANTYLYSRLLGDPAFQETLARYNLPLERIQLGHRQLQDTQAADRVKEDAKSEAQRATERRNKADEEFSNFVSKFFRVMRVALEDEPQLMEKIGITKPSAG